MPDEPPKVLEVGNLRIDRARHDVQVRGQAVQVTPTEFALLWTLALAQGEVVSRAELRDMVWGVGVDVGFRVVDIHIARLRRKLRAQAAPSPQDPVLQTVWGVGYQLRSRGAE